MPFCAASLVFDPYTLSRLWNPAGNADGSGAFVQWIFWVLLALMLGVSLGAVLAARRRDSRQADRMRRRLQAFLDDCGVTSQERTLLENLAATSGETLERVSRTVLGFDHAVDSLLMKLPDTSLGDRLLILRRLKSLRHKLALDRVAPGVPLVSSREIDLGQEILLRLSTVSPSRGLMATVVDMDETGFAVEIPPSSVQECPEVAEYLEALERQLIRGQTLLGKRRTGAPAGDAQQGAVEVGACFLREGDAGYRFGTVVNAVHLSDSVVLHLAHPQRLVRERRRDHLRVPTAGDVYLRRLANASGRTLEPGEVDPGTLDRHGKALDLSGGGFRLLTPDLPLERDEQIVARFPFLSEPLSGHLFVARVVHVYQGRTDFGLEFEELPEDLANALVREITEIHRQARVAVLPSVHA